MDKKNYVTDFVVENEERIILLKEEINRLEKELRDKNRQLKEALGACETIMVPKIMLQPYNKIKYDLGLSIRTLNVLTFLDTKYLFQVCGLSYIDLCKARGCGRKTFNEIIEFFKSYGLELNSDISKTCTRIIAGVEYETIPIGSTGYIEKDRDELKAAIMEAWRR